MSRILETVKVAEELRHGQIVIIIARWILVVSGLLLAMWNPAPMGSLRIQIVFILGVAMVNFYLHAQVLMGRPTIIPAVRGPTTPSD